jgi:hypothetical protein
MRWDEGMAMAIACVLGLTIGFGIGWSVALLLARSLP